MSDIDTLIERCEKQIDFMDSNIKKYIQMMEKKMGSTLCSEQLGELFTALAKAQNEMMNAEKNMSNDYLKSKYADLASIMDASRPYLSKNGLAIIQLPFTQDGDFYLKTVLGHTSGQFIETTMKIEVKEDTRPEKKTNFMHALGSAISYCRRYSYVSICGVAVGINDDDGNDSVPNNYAPKGAKPVPVISHEEAAIINGIIGDNEALFNELLKKAGITALGQLPKSKYNSAVLWLEEYGKKQ